MTDRSFLTKARKRQRITCLDTCGEAYRSKRSVKRVVGEYLSVLRLNPIPETVTDVLPSNPCVREKLVDLKTLVEKDRIEGWPWILLDFDRASLLFIVLKFTWPYTRLVSPLIQHSKASFQKYTILSVCRVLGAHFSYFFGLPDNLLVV